MARPSPRLKSRGWCGDLCWDEPNSNSERCRMHIIWIFSKLFTCMFAIFVLHLENTKVGFGKNKLFTERPYLSLDTSLSFSKMHSGIQWGRALKERTRIALWYQAVLKIASGLKRTPIITFLVIYNRQITIISTDIGWISQNSTNRDN